MGLILRDVAAARGEFRLEVSFESSARRLAVFGRSGSGKTTLLDAIAGLITPQRGRIEAGGAVFFDASAAVNLPPRRRGVGYVRQSLDLFPKMTVEENLRFAEDRPGASGRFERSEILSAFGLEPLRRRFPAELSGGEARRAQMARAVASEPSLLLLDEPLANLDEASRREILPFFSSLEDRFGLPALLVSHRFDEVLAFAEEVVVLEGGRVTASGEPFATLARPTLWPVARLAGVENVLAGVVEAENAGEGGSVFLWEGVRWRVPALSAPPGTRVCLGLFAADILLARDFSGRVSARNCLDGLVERVTESGGEALVELRVGTGRLVARVTRGALRELAVVAGTGIRLLVKSTAFQLLTGLE